METSLREQGETALQKIPETPTVDFPGLEHYIYEHKTQYYETDQMGIIHHTNYLKWFEELRSDIMEKIGLGYASIEEKGISIPVLSINCEYKKMVRYGDTVLLKFKIVEYNGIRFTICYQVINKENGELCAAGESRHCFLDKEGKPIYLKKMYPDVYDRIYHYLIEKQK